MDDLDPPGPCDCALSTGEAVPSSAAPPVVPHTLPRPLWPAVKLQARGPSALSSGELLSLLLGGKPVEHPVSPVVRRLLARYGLRGLAALGPQDWRAIRGIGRGGATRLAAAFELGRRLRGCGDEATARPKVATPTQAWRLVRHVARARKEHLVGLYLDAQSGLLHRETISIGSLNTTRTHPREILFPAVTHLALGFVLAHNHPSGCLEPSTEDLDFTRGVRRAGELMGIELYDHLIVAGNGFTSLRERGSL